MDRPPNRDFEDSSPSALGHELRERRAVTLPLTLGGVATLTIIITIVGVFVVVVGELAVEEL